MLDVLVALLLLAVALTGACATLVQALRATGDALRATQAADLAADFTEGLRGVTSPAQREALLVSWQTKVAAALPVTGMMPEEFATLVSVTPEPAEGATPVVSLLQLRLRWRGSGGEVRELGLPLAAGIGGMP